MEFVKDFNKYAENCKVMGIEASVKSYERLLKNIEKLKSLIQCDTLEEYVNSQLLLGVIYPSVAEAEQAFMKFLYEKKNNID